MSDENAPISIDSAVSMMLDKAPAAAPEAPAEKGTRDLESPQAGAEAPQEPQQNTDKSADSAGDEKPATDDAPAATDDDDDQGSLPPIEAPSSWTTEEKEVFKTSPRKVQEAIARREQERTTELRNGQNSVAEQRKAVDAEVTRLKGLAEKMDGVIKEQADDIARDFPEIKSQADVEALASRDASRFAQFQARLMRFNAMQQAKADADTELANKAKTQQQEAMAASHKELVKHFPTWSDPKVAMKEATELQDYAVKAFGISEQAARGLHNPVIYRMAQKAMLYDRAQAAKAAAVNRDAPRTVQPGATSATPKADRNAAARKAAIAKLDKSGDIEDALSLMRM